MTDHSIFYPKMMAGTPEDRAKLRESRAKQAKKQQKDRKPHESQSLDAVDQLWKDLGRK